MFYKQGHSTSLRVDLIAVFQYLKGWLIKMAYKKDGEQHFVWEDRTRGMVLNRKREDLD